MLPLVVSRLPGMLIAALCLFALGRTARLLEADLAAREGGLAALERSARLDPSAARYLALARLDPDGEDRHWRRALAVEPRSAEAHLHLGWRAESLGDWSAAEAHFRRAAALDGRYRVRWAWLEFLARRQRETEFWAEAPAVFAMSFGDRQSLFELAWEAAGPARRRMVERVLPDQPPVLFEYTQFLMRKEDMEGARRVFLRLVDLPVGSVHRANAGRVATREERRALGLDLCDLLFDRRDPAGARRVWRALGQAGLIPARIDGLFERPPSGRAFDWRIENPPGVEQRLESGWRMEFSGRQADQIRLMWRWLPFDQTRAARIVTEFAPGAPPEGLWWRVTIPGPETELAAARASEPLRVLAPPGVKLARLELAYRRMPGELPLRGAVRILRSGEAGD